MASAVAAAEDEDALRLITATDYYVDPQNSTGNASDATANPGTSADSPLLTYFALSQRLNGGVFLQNVTVHQLSSPCATSDIYCARTIQGGAAFGQMIFKGEAPTVHDTVVLTGVQARDPVTGTRPEITVTDYDFSEHVGRRVRITDGSNPGYYAWIIKTGSTDATAVLATDAINPAFGSSTSPFEVGDTVVIESLTEFCQLAAITDGVWYTNNPAEFRDFAIGETGETFIGAGPANFLGCLLRAPGLFPRTYLALSGCQLKITSELDGTCPIFFLQTWFNCGSNFTVRNNSNTLYSNCTTTARLSFHGRHAIGGAFGCFDWSGGAAVHVGTGSTIDASARVWGTSAVANTFGIRLSSGGQFHFGTGDNTPVVAGALSGTKDVEIGDTDLEYATVLPNGHVNDTNLAAMIPRAV